MAEGKNSIIVYRDWIDIFKDLSDEEAGKLIKYFFKYVNDLNPEPPDRITGLMFNQIKSTLKRDLKKWEAKSQKNRENALKRWDKNNANASERINRNANHADSDSVNDSDNVSDKEEEKKDIFNFKKSLLELGISEQVVSDWLKVRAKKKAANTETAFNRIKSEIIKAKLPPHDCIKYAVEKSWQGFQADWLKDDIKPTGQKLSI